jgi:hypothetical protein
MNPAPPVTRFRYATSIFLSYCTPFFRLAALNAIVGRSLSVCIPAVINRQHEDSPAGLINQEKQSKVADTIPPCVWRIAPQFLDIRPKERVFSELRVDVLVKLAL